MRLGVLDVGSNTVHLQIMDAYVGSAPIPYESFKQEVRLAEYLDNHGAISESGIEQLIKAISEVFHSSHAIELDETLAFATSAIREATNSMEVLTRVENQTGIKLEVLSGQEEASLTFLAARRWFGWHMGDLLVLDIGGGSLEIAYGVDESPSYTQSVMLGAGRLTRDFLEGDPFSDKSLGRLAQHIWETLDPIAQDLRNATRASAVGTSKTFRTLRRLQTEFLPELGNNLTLEGLDLIAQKLQKMTLKQRRDLPGVSQGRAQQIVAGAMVARATLEKLNIESVIQCPWALREGIILHRIDWIHK